MAMGPSRFIREHYAGTLLFRCQFRAEKAICDLPLWPKNRITAIVHLKIQLKLGKKVVEVQCLSAGSELPTAKIGSRRS